MSRRSGERVRFKSPPTGRSLAGETEEGSSKVRLVGKAGRRGDIRQSIAARDQRNSLQQSGASPVGFGRDVIGLPEASTDALGPQPDTFAPGGEGKLRIQAQVVCQTVRPVESDLDEGRKLAAKHAQRLRAASLGGPDHSIRIFNAAERRARRQCPGQHQNLRAARPDIVEMGLVGAMENYVSGRDMPPTGVPRLQVSALQDEGGERFAMAVPREPLAATVPEAPGRRIGQALCRPECTGSLIWDQVGSRRDGSDYVALG